ncbi:hypothetical protein [Paracoccus sp. PAMC 22219]|uniref:hypothetical protein n=1 Tax=Paracoccus sp. PAMC 22219 TaxID=1569209 RepID=UPI0012DFF947|nr:hypothetical protein [Paracoccus sp. PAMC 22219]
MIDLAWRKRIETHRPGVIARAASMARRHARRKPMLAKVVMRSGLPSGRFAWRGPVIAANPRIHSDANRVSLDEINCRVRKKIRFLCDDRDINRGQGMEAS